jgi:adenylate cyclase
VDAEQDERRLAAIINADIVGYSRLMAEDEDATVRMVTFYRQQVEMLVPQHRGQLVDFTGDNFLAQFPTALEAVRCAIEIQRVLAARNKGLPGERRMEFRIGIHLGDVREAGKRLFGTGVNIAARVQSLAQPGGICVSGMVKAQLEGKLELDCEDLGEQTVKNIPEPVRVYRVRMEGKDAATPPRAGGTWWSRQVLGTAAAALALLFAAALWLQAPEEPIGPPLPAKPSVVVLPFDDMGGGSAQEYFADGITEDLTNDLAGIPDLFVIARNTAFTYKHQPVRVEQVGRDLGVRYVLEGSVRRDGDRVRVTAQLIDATTGLHIWSDRYDRELSDIFAVQADIADQILTALTVQVRSAELGRIQRRSTRSLTAYEAFLQGLAHHNRLTTEDNRSARQLFQRAIELDPAYADAYWGLGVTLDREGANLSGEARAKSIEGAERAARRALELDPLNSRAMTLLGFLAAEQGKLDEGLMTVARAKDLAPSLPEPYTILAVLQARAGNLPAALESANRARRLDPQGESMTTGILGGIRYLAGTQG